MPPNIIQQSMKQWLSSLHTGFHVLSLQTPMMNEHKKEDAAEVFITNSSRIDSKLAVASEEVGENEGSEDTPQTEFQA